VPRFEIRGEDGINREVELELGECDLCHKLVLQAKQDILPPPFTERQWPAVAEQMWRLGMLPDGPHPTDWDR